MISVYVSYDRLLSFFVCFRSVFIRFVSLSLQNYFVSFDLGSKRFSYLLDPKGFRIFFWIQKVFDIFWIRKVFVSSVGPKDFRIFRARHISHKYL
jgi:hypothetical protein